MGTRAAFWVGNPTQLDKREWLGCIAFDGHPENFEQLAGIVSEKEYRDAVQVIRDSSRDFATPDKGWPFPWADDIFLTDITYAFFGGVVQVCWFHSTFVSLNQYLVDPGVYCIEDVPEHINVPCGKPYDPSQPDSIMIIQGGKVVRG